MGATTAKTWTSEWIDRVLSRPVATLLVAPLLRTHITPNQVTFVTAGLGVAAGYGLARGTPLSLSLSAVAILGVLVLDCVDGQLARARGGGTRLGRFLDGASDYVTAIALHVGAMFYLARTNHAGLPALPTIAEIGIVVAAGFLLAVRAGMYDELKQRVRRLTDVGVDERDSPEVVLEEIRAERRPLVRLCLRCYLVYCRLQTTPEREPAPTPEGTAVSIRALRGWSFLGPSTHLLVLAIAMLASIAWPDGIRCFFLLSVGPGAIAMVALRPVTAKARGRT